VELELERLELDRHGGLTSALRDRFAEAYATGAGLGLDDAVARGLALIGVVSTR